MFKHGMLQRTTLTVKGYCRAREESVTLHLFSFIIYQMEAVIPIECVIVIFSVRRIFAINKLCHTIPVIYSVCL